MTTNQASRQTPHARFVSSMLAAAIKIIQTAEAAELPRCLRSTSRTRDWTTRTGKTLTGVFESRIFSGSVTLCSFLLRQSPRHFTRPTVRPRVLLRSKIRPESDRALTRIIPKEHAINSIQRNNIMIRCVRGCSNRLPVYRREPDSIDFSSKT